MAGSAEVEITAKGASVRSREGIVTIRDPASDAPMQLSPGSGAVRDGVGSDRPASIGNSGGIQQAGEGSGNSVGAGEAGNRDRGPARQ